MRRLFLILALVAGLNIPGAAHAGTEGGVCRKFVREAGRVTAITLGRVFNTVTVAVGTFSGSRRTTVDFVADEEVFVTGLACDGRIGLPFSIYR